jgi:MinD-like ATPase involved in chromosome partitioning or flagellar assembly
MRLHPQTWGIAGGDSGSGKTTVAGCLAALIQLQGDSALVVDADLRRQNYMLSATVNTEPDVLFTRILSEGYLAVLRRMLGQDLERTIRGLDPLFQSRQDSSLQLLLDFGAGPSDKYAEFFPLVTNPIVVADRSGESVAKALSFSYRALLRCLQRRLRSIPEAAAIIRQALARETKGAVTRLSEVAYHIMGVNRHAAEVARSLIRDYRPKVVLNRLENVEEERKLRRLLAHVRLETDLDIAFGGSLHLDPRLGGVADEVAKMSLDDPESEYAIWLAREFARKLQGDRRAGPKGSPPRSKPGPARRKFLGGLFGSMVLRWSQSSLSDRDPSMREMNQGKGTSASRQQTSR